MLGRAMVGDIRWSSCTVGWRGLWGSLGADTVICCVAYGGLLSGHVLPSGRYIRRAALERRQGLHQVSWLICRFLVIFVPRSINHGEIFQCPIAQGTDGLSE